MPKTILPAVLLVFMFASCSGSKWIKGSWEGVGLQIDDRTWNIALDAQNDKDIKIEYPSLSCGGVWTVMEKGNNQITFKENITYGILNCDQGVEAVVTKLGNDEIEVVYYLRSYDPDKPIARGTLKRRNGI